MRSILALGVLITLYGFANAATVHHAHLHHAHRRHAIIRPHDGMFASGPASGFAYASPQPPFHYRPAPYHGFNEPYYGASQGYAPGEKERFLGSVFSP
jgi:hypothetical protein